MWGVVEDHKLLKLTFSKSLADMLIGLDEKYQIQRFEAVVGKELARGDISKTGIYLIVSQRGIVLRASLIREIAEMYRDESRRIFEGHLVK